MLKSGDLVQQDMYLISAPIYGAMANEEDWLVVKQGSGRKNDAKDQGREV
jgi:hypothetical protein